MSQTKWHNIFRYFVDSRCCSDTLWKFRDVNTPIEKGVTIINGNFRILEGVLLFPIHYTHSLVPPACSHSLCNSLCDLERFSVLNVSGSSRAPFSMTWRLLDNHTSVFQSSSQNVMHKKANIWCFSLTQWKIFKRGNSFWCQEGISSN